MGFLHCLANLQRHALILILVVTLSSVSTASATDNSIANLNPPQMDQLVSTQWLSEHLDDPDIVVLDTSVIVKLDENGGFQLINGRGDYEKGHIPSAGFADLMGNLSDQESPLDFVMPAAAQFAAAIGALGVGNDNRVILYDTNNAGWAARVWWMLKWAGFDNAAVLDGGLQAWKAEKRPLSTEPANRAAKNFSIALRPELIADRDEVYASIDNNEVSIIDAMSDAHYLGQFAMYARPGHIKSASNMPSSDLLDGTGHYRSLDELELLHGDSRNGRAITYCGGGIAASSVAFTMSRLGYSNVAVYMGSLQEWAPEAANLMTTVPSE